MKIVESGKHVFLLEYIFQRRWAKSGRVLFAESNLENTQALTLLPVHVNTMVNLRNLRRLSARMKYWRGNLRSLFRRLDVDINNAAKEKRMIHLGSLYCAFARRTQVLREEGELPRDLLVVRIFRIVFDLPETRRSRRHARWSGNILALSSTGRRGNLDWDLASERGHIRRIFPSDDVEMRINRFLHRNSRSISATHFSLLSGYSRNCFRMIQNWTFLSRVQIKLKINHTIN